MTAPKKREGGRFARLLGSYWRSPKRLALTPEARDLYTAGLSYCADNVTDGKIPKYMLPALLGAEHTALPAALLCAYQNGECPFWYDRGDHYEIHDFLEENPSRAELEALSERGRAKAARRWAAAGHLEQSTDAVCNAPGNAQDDAQRDAIPHPSSHIPASQIPDPTHNARARDEVHEIPLSEVQAGQRVIECFDAAWERHHGVSPGVAMMPTLKARQLAQATAQWAQKTAPMDPWGLVERACVGAVQDPSVVSAHHPFNAFAEKPGTYLAKRGAKTKGPAPPRRSDEFEHDDPKEFWSKVKAENAANE